MLIASLLVKLGTPHPTALAQIALGISMARWGADLSPQGCVSHQSQRRLALPSIILRRSSRGIEVGGFMRIRHVIQTPGPSAPRALMQEFEWAQTSISQALAIRKSSNPIDVVAAHFPRERPNSGPWTSYVELRRDSRSIEGLPQNRRLPFLADVISAFGDPETYDFGVLTNADIILHPHFYDALKSLLERDSSTTSITRRSVYPDNIQSPGPDFSYGFSYAHPGHDCLIAPSSVFSKVPLSDVILGAQFSDIPLVWALRLLDDQFRIRGDLSLTFHMGDERAPLEGLMRSFAWHNVQQIRILAQDYRRQFPNRKINNLKHVTRLCDPNYQRNLFSESPANQYVPPIRRPQFRGLPRIIFTQMSGHRQASAVKNLVKRNSMLQLHSTEYRGENPIPHDEAHEYARALSAKINDMSQSEILVDVTPNFVRDLAEPILAKFDHEVIYVMNIQDCAVARTKERAEIHAESATDAGRVVLDEFGLTHQLRRLTPQVTWIDVLVNQAHLVKINNDRSNQYLLNFRKPFRRGLKSCRGDNNIYVYALEKLLPSTQTSTQNLWLCRKCRKSLDSLLAT